MTHAVALAWSALCLPARLVVWFFWTTLWALAFVVWATVYRRERAAALAAGGDLADSFGPVLLVAGAARVLGLKPRST